MYLLDGSWIPGTQRVGKTQICWGLQWQLFTINSDFGSLLNCLLIVKIKLNSKNTYVIRQSLGEGINIRAIANELNVSKNTVLLAKEMYKVFVLVVFEKLGLKENISVSVI
jgi:hypothetical protein